PAPDHRIRTLDDATEAGRDPARAPPVLTEHALHEELGDAERPDRLARLVRARRDHASRARGTGRLEDEKAPQDVRADRAGRIALAALDRLLRGEMEHDLCAAGRRGEGLPVGDVSVDDRERGGPVRDGAA